MGTRVATLAKPTRRDDGQGADGYPHLLGQVMLAGVRYDVSAWMPVQGDRHWRLRFAPRKFRRKSRVVRLDAMTGRPEKAIGSFQIGSRTYDASIYQRLWNLGEGEVRPVERVFFEMHVHGDEVGF